MTPMTSLESHFAELMVNLRVADVLDIGVISLLAYLFVQWLIRHATLSVGVLLVTISILYTVAYATNMHMTLFVFRAMAIAIAIVILLIYRRELRRGLENLTAWRPFPNRSAEPHTDWLADVLTESTATLAQQRIGALIVLQGKEPIEGHVRGGVRLGGKVSIPLLHSIFQPQSQAHDGAVLIEGGEVARFGVHLPLSENLREVGNSGTRHTAALGLAERCDAMVLVVSEERGTTSVAQEGKIFEVESPADLSKRLHHFCGTAQVEPFAKKRWRNPVLACGSLVFACIAWLLFVYQVETILRPYEDVPIEFRNVPEDWAIHEVNPETVRITLAGPKRAFSGLAANEIVAAVKLGRLAEGRQEISLTQEVMDLDPELTLRGVEPGVVQFRAEPLISTSVPVKVRLEGKPPSPLAITKVTANPADVILRGPRSVVSRYDHILTEPIAAERITGSVTLRTALAVPNETNLQEGQEPFTEVTIQATAKEGDSGP